jgi:hypothetical protein
MPHCGISWDEVYKGWQNPDVQYYWKKYDMRLSPWNDLIKWQKDRIC